MGQVYVVWATRLTFALNVARYASVYLKARRPRFIRSTLLIRRCVIVVLSNVAEQTALSFLTIPASIRLTPACFGGALGKAAPSFIRIVIRETILTIVFLVKTREH